MLWLLACLAGVVIVAAGCPGGLVVRAVPGQPGRRAGGALRALAAAGHAARHRADGGGGLGRGPVVAGAPVACRRARWPGRSRRSLACPRPRPVAVAVTLLVAVDPGGRRPVARAGRWRPGTRTGRSAHHDMAVGALATRGGSGSRRVSVDHGRVISDEVAARGRGARGGDVLPGLARPAGRGGRGNPARRAGRHGRDAAAGTGRRAAGRRAGRAPPLGAAAQAAPLPSGRSWGFTVQLYSLRSRRSWGHGDLRDLADLRGLERPRARRASFVLINPLHAAEPVPPVSRLPTCR